VFFFIDSTPVERNDGNYKGTVGIVSIDLRDEQTYKTKR
jgi:hypothetical protein